MPDYLAVTCAAQDADGQHVLIPSSVYAEPTSGNAHWLDALAHLSKKGMSGAGGGCAIRMSGRPEVLIATALQHM